MVLPIYVYGHPILRRKSTNISMDYPKLQELIADMFETMYHDQGVGLAAPQIGKSIRLFVIDTSAYKESHPEIEPFKGVFINPVIKNEFGNDFTFREGCLSIPDLHAEITRKAELELSYLDEKGIQQQKTFNSLTARVIQHELDHLEGKVFVDYLTAIKKMVVKRKLADIANGKYKPSYRSNCAK